eukprot:TRINITY_DN397_c0_g1_i4.p1 TRINITY_DN397_c0_g1~~TRINITY_DN397_c0_g1_i4.p1  ORF type:complete len:521 (+),score=194.59 TRINITY_DN397_c0_g1_i4:124-1563(+)
MPGARLLDMLEPMLKLLPEVEKASPQRPIQVQDRVLFTGLCLLVFLVCCQIPLYGIQTKSGADPFYWMRVILASNKGTLMELGVSPIVTSSLVMQMLQGAKMLQMDERSQRDRRLFQGVQKLFGIIITFGLAVIYVSSGMYGGNLSTVMQAVLVAQLAVAGVICLLLDEVLQRGYGFGSGISLFIATNVCETIIWKSFSFITVNAGRGPEFEGAITALFHQLLQNTNKVRALKEAFYRPHLPNVINLVATLAVFLVVVFFQSFAVTLPLVHSRTGQQHPQRIKLFYTSNMPIVLQAAFVSNLYFLSQVLYKQFPSNAIVNCLGQWSSPELAHSALGQSVPTGGLAFLVSPPQSLSEFIYDPFHVVFYITFVLSSCAFFSKTWIAVSNQTPNEVATQWYDRGLILPGHKQTKEHLKAQLDRYVPVAATLGGVSIGALTVAADLLGAIGTGTGILLAVTFVYQYYEQLEQENYLPALLKGH